MELSRFFQLSVTAIILLVIMIALVAAFHNTKTGLVITESILGVSLAAVVILFGIIAIPLFTKSILCKETTSTYNIVPNSETIKPASFTDGERISFVINESNHNISFLTDDIKINIVAESETETYIQTKWSMLFVYTTNDKINMKADTYNRLFN